MSSAKSTKAADTQPAQGRIGRGVDEDLVVGRREGQYGTRSRRMWVCTSEQPGGAEAVRFGAPSSAFTANRGGRCRCTTASLVVAHPFSVAVAERETLKFVKRYCYVRTAPLCGNSIGQDKRFLAKYMPSLHDFLHYKVVDVSSIKVLVSEWYAGRFESPEKQELHRALADIEESIEELKYYRKNVFVRSRR